ncbi:MAG: phosphotransferase family protein [Candidatus Hydrogenedentes bacterium]|nr:phosphotransferase family protein [Candidatus Hydrogenedentota bacterium]
MSDLSAEVIEVRTDERFDEVRLAEYLGDKLEGSGAALTVAQFGGGHANLTYLLRFSESGDGDDTVEYVLRRPPLGPVAKSSHDMNREYRALSKLWRAFDKAPRAYLYCDDASIIGCDFIVMERRHGIVVRNEIPPEFGGGNDPAANRELSEVVIDTLVEFHAVDPVAVGLDDLGKPEGFLERQVRGWTDRYERARTDDVPVALEVSSWLIDNMPKSPRPTLVHNDWKLDNMAMDPKDPGNCMAVYDWDMCTLGDPLCDVGTLLGLWSNRGAEPTGISTVPPVEIDKNRPFQRFQFSYGDREYNLGEGPYLIAMLNATCEHCIRSVPDLNVLARSPELPEMVALMMADPGDEEAQLRQFRLETQPEFPTQLIGMLDFVEFIESAPPRLIYVKDGIEIYGWDWDDHAPGIDEVQAAIRH